MGCRWGRQRWGGWRRPVPISIWIHTNGGIRGIEGLPTLAARQLAIRREPFDLTIHSRRSAGQGSNARSCGGGGWAVGYVLIDKEVALPAVRKDQPINVRSDQAEPHACSCTHGPATHVDGVQVHHATVCHAQHVAVRATAMHDEIETLRLDLAAIAIDLQNGHGVRVQRHMRVALRLDGQVSCDDKRAAQLVWRAAHGGDDVSDTRLRCKRAIRRA